MEGVNPPTLNSEHIITLSAPAKEVEKYKKKNSQQEQTPKHSLVRRFYTVDRDFQRHVHNGNGTNSEQPAETGTHSPISYKQKLFLRVIRGFFS